MGPCGRAGNVDRHGSGGGSGSSVKKVWRMRQQLGRVGGEEDSLGVDGPKASW